MMLAKGGVSGTVHAGGQGILSWFSPLAERVFAKTPKPQLPHNAPPEDDGFRQIAFTFAVIALSAKLSQVDGKVTREEIFAFRQLFPVAPTEHTKIHRLFVMACADPKRAEHYARQVKELFPGQRKLYIELLDRLFKIAVADKALQPSETDFLRKIAGCLGVRVSEFRRIQGIYTSTRAADPYSVLGLSSRVSNDNLKLAYRTLIRDNHPDILAARGGSAEAVSRAGARVAEINHAYDRVLRKRGLK